MAQLSSVALAVKNYQRTLIGRQFTLEYVKLAIRNADGRGDVALVIFWFQRPGIHQDHLVCCNLLGHILHGYSCIGALGFHPGWISAGVDLDIGVAEFFRLPGGFMAQLSGGALAVKNQQRIFILGQFIRHLSELTVRNTDRRGDVADGILGLVRS